MSHPNENLSAYLSGELNAQEAKQIEDHLVQCRQCTLELQNLQKLNHLLNSQEPLEVSPGFLSGILQKIQNDQKITAFRSRRTVAILAIAAGIAFFAILIFMRDKTAPHGMVQHPQKIEQSETTQPRTEIRQPSLAAEDAEIVAHLDALEDMDVIREYEDLEDLDVAVLMNHGEEVK